MMAVEQIEGEAVVVYEPRMELAATITPEDTVALASRIATQLKDIVERQKLYAIIQGKKFPQVEAWMTVARMDNVVAREVVNGISRHDDGSYEAHVELIRLSDGLVIGHGSALCGSAGDRPWDSRPEPARRSMAVTRATSRAFRQQYSWIMALAGYEPTPAEEMPRDDAPQHPRAELERRTHEPLIGKAETGKGDADFELRQTPDGWALVFRLVAGRKGWKVLARNELAQAISTMRSSIEGQRVRAWGVLVDESFDKDGRTITYQILHLERLATDEFTLPASTEPEEPTPAEAHDDDLSDLPW